MHKYPIRKAKPTPKAERPRPPPYSAAREKEKRRIIIESYTDDARVSHKKYTGIYGGKGRASDRGEWIG